MLYNVGLILIRFLFKKLFIFGCAGSSLLQGLISSLRVGAALCCSAGFSLQWFLLLRSTGSRIRVSVLVASGLRSCGSPALEYRLNS